MNPECLKWVEEARDALGRFDTSQLDPAVKLCATCLRSGGTVFFCGNGGSAADSQHMAAELVGRFLSDRKPLRAVSLSDNTASITAIANDYGYEHVFSRQLRALAREGDVLFAISTSGASPSVLEAAAAARSMGVRVVAMTGSGGGDFASTADASIRAPAGISGHVQEVLMAAGHAICAALEVDLAGICR